MTLHCQYNAKYALYVLLKSMKDDDVSVNLDKHIEKVDGLKEWFEKEHESMSMTQEQRAAQIASSPWYD